MMVQCCRILDSYIDSLFSELLRLLMMN